MIDPEDHSPSLGTAYQATANGFKRLWQSKGWYGYPDELFLAPDGMSLVRIARFPDTLNGKKIENQTVLFIYFKGSLVRDYKLSDVVRDIGGIEDLGSSGGFGSRWIDQAGIVQSDWHDIDTDRKDGKPDERTLRSYNHFAFRLKTLDESELFFDLLDGRRIEKTKIVVPQENEGASGMPCEDQKSEPDGTGQPAARPESRSEGGDKPQPESEGRSRQREPGLDVRP